MAFENPFDADVFARTATIWGGMLAAILVALLIIARKNLRQLNENSLFLRWRTWTIIAPIYMLAVLGGEVALALLVTLLIFQGLREYARLVGLPRRYTLVLLGMGLTAAPVAALSLDGFHFLPPLLLIVATLQPLLFGGIAAGVRHLAFAALGWGYIAWLLAHIPLIHSSIDGGPGILLAMGLAIAMSDVGAFIVGRSLGRHQLAPRLSPNKTWEGAVGNFIGAGLGIAIMAFALPDKNFWLIAVGLPMVIGLGSIWGDLVESSIKREFEAKDAGAWLPGFGGLLDRIDSLIMVAPLTYYVLRLAG